jgi:uncharacterized damage-inducible protein DinB
MSVSRRCLRRAAAAAACAAVASFVLASGVAAQEPASGLRAELIADVEQVEAKYVALADALTAHYTWRPGEGVRSVSEVLMHVAGTNYMLPSMLGVALPDGLPGGGDMRALLGALERETDPSAVRDGLRHSFAHAKHAIAEFDESRGDESFTLFGRQTTRRAALLLFVTHMHEHLGQAIAYARTNGVVPPWSGGND